jgi:tripartite-type tricarboxylate transporter receptor subunit TctC
MIARIARFSLGLLLLLTGLAAAQDATQRWPQRAVKFIVPLGPGSGVDIVARLYADRLSARWGQPVVVENRPGSDALLAIGAFVGAQDDHVLLFAPTSTFTAHPYQHQKLPYEPADLVPIARLTNTLVAAGVPASLKVESLADLLALARAKPGTMNSAGTTGAVEFVVAGFLSGAGADVTRVPYRDGVQAVNDLAEGRIQLYVAALAIMRPHVESGKVRIVAITNRERAPSLPQVATAAEQGHPALTFDGLSGLFGPRGFPPALSSRIAADIKEISADPEIAARLVATGQLLRPGDAEALAAEIEDQRARVAAAAKASGAKALMQ